jgi:protein ImuB
MFACVYCQNLTPGVSLADFAYSFSPLVEETALDTVVLDVEGCELLFGSAYELANDIANRAASAKAAGGLGCKVNVAIAGNPDAAIHAARFYQGISFISPGEELTGLGDLPIESLQFQVTSPGPMSNVQSPTLKKKTLDIGHRTLDEKEFQDICETLRLWGVRTFRDFAALPLTGVSERLGQTGVKLQQLAGGKTKRHLKLKQPAPVFHHSLELEHPIAELEPLSFIFARLLNQLCATLDTYALATNELRVQLKLENQESHERVLNLPHPMRDNKVFLKLLLLDTEMHPPASAVAAVSIGCEPVKPRVLQNGLFIPLAPEPEKLELILARLAKLLGPENVGSPELIDTHRPDAFRVKRFALKTTREKKRRTRKASLRPAHPPVSSETLAPLIGFRIFRPPLKAMVEATRGYPTQISAWSKKLSVHGKIVRLAGPWRTTGDWWRLKNWARDEWDVAVESRSGSTVVSSHTDLPTQVLYRIYRDLRNGSWFVEGSYD